MLKEEEQRERGMDSVFSDWVWHGIRCESNFKKFTDKTSGKIITCLPAGTARWNDE